MISRPSSAALLFFFLVCAPAVSVAGPRLRSVRIDALTWTEVAQAERDGVTTVLIPVGGTEQSGPYMALGKHNARVRVLSGDIARRLGNALVAPVVAYVPEGNYAPPTSHMRFPGTITVAHHTFRHVLEWAANSFRVHGFHYIVFLGDHGGYQRDLVRVAEVLNRQWRGRGARALVPPAYYRTSSRGFDHILRDKGYADNVIGTHAGLADTSLLLAVAPGLVRVRAMRDAPKPGPGVGVYGGDPRGATSALGALGVAAIIERTVTEIRQETRGEAYRSSARK